jgi:hypothetical protein
VLDWFAPNHPYRQRLAEVAAMYGAETYPGSPLIAATGLRETDRMHLAELHPQEYAALSELMAGWGADVRREDGLAMALALTPPTPRRGVMLIDPSYEVKTDYDRIPRVMAQVARKWNVGHLMLWYPILSDSPHRPMLSALQATFPEGLRHEVGFPPARAGHRIDTRLALAALLVRVARTDGLYAAEEVDRIDRVLMALRAWPVRGRAPARPGRGRWRREAPDTVRFTRALKEATRAGGPQPPDGGAVVGGAGRWQPRRRGRPADAAGGQPSGPDRCAKRAGAAAGGGQGMIASLGMYDFGAAQGANDRLWARSARRACAPRDRGAAGADPRRGRLLAGLASPDLVLSQTCGYPYRARLHGRVDAGRHARSLTCPAARPGITIRSSWPAPTIRARICWHFPARRWPGTRICRNRAGPARWQTDTGAGLPAAPGAAHRRAPRLSARRWPKAAPRSPRWMR